MSARFANQTLLGLTAIVFSFFMVKISGVRPFWYDEMYTYLIATQPSLKALWHALSSAGDFNPPLLHILGRAFMTLGLAPELAFRIPSIASFLLLSGCLYHFTAKRYPAPYAWAAALLALHPIAYAHEARAYGLMMGFSALALLSWQNSERVSTHRLSWKWPTCLGVSLALASSSHLFGCLSVFPIAIGESLRLSKGKSSRATWLAIALSLLILIPYSGIISYSTQFTELYWSKLSFTRWLDAYRYAGEHWLLPFAIALGLSLVARFFLRRDPLMAHKEKMPWGFKDEEWATAFGFLLIPTLGVLLSLLVQNHAYTSRHYLCATLGISLVGTAIIATISNKSHWSAMLLVAFSLRFLGESIAFNDALAFYQAEGLSRISEKISQFGKSQEPIASFDVLQLLPLYRHLDRKTQERFVYLSHNDVDQTPKSMGQRCCAHLDLKTIIPWNTSKIESMIKDNGRVLAWIPPAWDIYTWSEENLFRKLEDVNAVYRVLEAGAEGWFLEIKSRPKRNKIGFDLRQGAAPP